MDRKTVTGAILAAAVGAMFLATPVLAQSSSGGSANGANVKCIGGNSCKGQSLCKSFDHDCQAMNSCKGKGFVMMTGKECQAKGGKATDPDQM